MVLAAQPQLRLDANWVDYLLIAIYFVFVIGIGVMARRSVSTSLDFFLSGRSLPAWVTGLAFISANLGAVEIMGMSANGAQFGIPTVHYFWVGAVPAMLFLGVVMMPFYYGSKVRSVPEFMRKRFGTGAHLVNALSFAIAQLLIAGINLFLLAKIVNILLGWNLYVSLVVAAIIVLSYITLGGLSAAIYNEVLQFFIIVAALLPLTLVGLHKVGGYSGLEDKITAAGDGSAQLNSWPGTNLTAIDSPVLSVIGIVFGLGFVLSFGYWTTNFVEVQRAMASNSMSAAKRAPIIGSSPTTGGRSPRSWGTPGPAARQAAGTAVHPAPPDRLESRTGRDRASARRIVARAARPVQCTLVIEPLVAHSRKQSSDSRALGKCCGRVRAAEVSAEGAGDGVHNVEVRLRLTGAAATRAVPAGSGDQKLTNVPSFSRKEAAGSTTSASSGCLAQEDLLHHD